LERKMRYGWKSLKRRTCKMWGGSFKVLGIDCDLRDVETVDIWTNQGGG
jgi:hypothetical protein